MNQQEMRAILKHYKVGTYEWHLEGLLGDLVLAEVWVTQGRERDTRFLIIFPDKTTRCFDNFSELCAHLDQESPAHRKAESEIQMQRFSSYVAAFVFLMAVSTAIYIVTTQNDIKIAVVPFFLGLIASGGALFFGKWIMPSTR